MHSLRAFWNLLLPWPDAALTLYILTAIAVLFSPSILAKACAIRHRFA